MFMLKKMLLSGAVTTLGLALAGCQADGKAAQSSLTQTADGVTCDKCQTTWVKTHANPSGKGNILAYTRRPQHTCSDCRSAVSNYFQTGKLAHSCKTCDGNMEICKAHSS